MRSLAVAPLLEEVGDVHQVGMIEAGQHGRLLLELLAQLGQRLSIEPWLGCHLLESNGDVEPRVPGAIDRAHPPLPQQGDDAVAML